MVINDNHDNRYNYDHDILHGMSYLKGLIYNSWHDYLKCLKA